MEYTKEYLESINSLANLINEADAILIGAGAGLSTAAGYTYSGKRFHENFHDFEMKYGFRDMYSGGFYPYSSLEEYWAYWSRYIYINRYIAPPYPVYERLFSLVKNKDYFVLTTNVDHCFQKAGFQKERLFYTQGDYGLFQCSTPCHYKTYDNESAVKRMVETQKDMKIPTELIPRCPKCGKPLTMNLRADDKFVEDKGWYIAHKNYKDFLQKNEKKRIVYIELGVGMNTPVIIKYPFWQYTYRSENARYVCINKDSAYVPNEIAARSLCMQENIRTVIDSLFDRQKAKENQV